MKRYGCNGTVWRVVPNSETTKTREKFRLFKSRLKKLHKCCKSRLKKFAFRIKSCLKNINILKSL